jgi:hypothetical protein
MAHQRPRLRYSRTLALLVSAVTGFGSIIGLIFVAKMSQGVPTTALVNILSVFLSLGIVGIVYDIFLRGSVLNETLEIVGIEESVANIGLRNIQQDSSPDWKVLCSGSQRISILLTDPLAWARSQWTHVLETACIRAVDVSVYIPRADGDHVDSLASRLGFASSDFVSQLKSAKDFLETSWSAATKKESLKKGSKFSLRTYQGVAGYEIGLFDDQAVIMVSDPLDRDYLAHSLVLEFSGTTARPLYNWLYGQLTRLDAGPTTEFTSEVR